MILKQLKTMNSHLLLGRSVSEWLHEVYTERQSEHDSCHGDVPLDVSCFLSNKIAVLGKNVKWTAIRLKQDTCLGLAE